MPSLAKNSFNLVNSILLIIYPAVDIFLKVDESERVRQYRDRFILVLILYIRVNLNYYQYHQ